MAQAVINSDKGIPARDRCCRLAVKAYIRTELESGAFGRGFGSVRKRTWVPVGMYCEVHGLWNVWPDS